MLPVIFISLVFLSFFIFVYFNQEKNSKINTNKIRFNIIFIIVVTTVIKLVMSPYFKGYEVDMTTYISWMDRAGKGLNGFYAPDYFCDYPPLFIAMFGFLGFVKNLLFSNPSQQVSYFFVKMAGIIFDALISYEILKIYTKSFKKSSHMIFTAFLVFLPAFFYNSAVWGQTDSIMAYFLVLTFRMVLEDKLELSALFFTIAALLKPQSFLFAPIIAVLFIKSNNVIFIKDSHDFKKSTKILLNISITFIFSIAVMAVVMMPFRNGVPDLLFLIQKYTETFSSYAYASLNTFNLFNMLGGGWVDVNNNFLFMNYSVWGGIFIAASATGACLAVYFTKDKNKIYLILAVYLLSVVMLGAKMHERYWFSVIVFGFIYYAFSGEKKFFTLFTVLSISYLYNLHYAILSLQGSKDVLLPAVMTVCSIVNISILVYFIYQIYKYIREEYKITDSKKLAEYKKTGLRTDVIVVSVITLIYGLMAFYNLGSTKMPQSFVKLNKGDSILFEFDDIKNISDARYFVGHGLRTYSLMYSDDGISYTNVILDGNNEYKPYVFTWQKNEFENVNARYFKLTSNESGDDKSAFYGDMAFFERGSSTPIKYTAQITSDNDNNVLHLSDEYDAVPQIPSFENSFYFDEIYHGRTAFEYKYNLPVYETTHPPLGKLIISLGISIFGIHMFGFRVMGVIAGILLVPAFFLLAKKLLKNSIAAYFTTFIYTFDFMHLSHSRISSIDIYVVLFVVLSYYFMTVFFEKYINGGINKKSVLSLGLAGLFFGCAVAVKWTGVYAGFGLLAIYIASVIKSENKKTVPALLGYSVILFALIPALVYYFSYFNYFDGFGKPFNFRNFMDAQISIFDYHSKLTSTHPFSSPWYEWILNLRPIWMFSQSNLPDNATYTKTIATFGNFLVIWGGLAAFIYMIYNFFRNYNKKNIKSENSLDITTLVVTAAFFAQILPWVFVSRVTFIYHYFTIIPFISIAIGYYVNENIIKRQKHFLLPAVFAGLVFVLFVMYYPVLTGNVIDKSYLNWLKILPKWSF